MAFFSQFAAARTVLWVGLVAISALAGLFLPGCTMWSNRLANTTPIFVEDVPLRIEADFDLQDDSRVLQEIRNLKMELRDDLGIPFSNEKIRVRIFRNEASFGQFTAQHFPQLAGRRALFVVERGEYHVYAVWSDAILSDLRHELTHAYLNSSVGTLPLWLDEGLAEYYEVVGVPQRINREHLPWLTDGLKNYTWRPDLDRLAAVARPEQMTHTDYAESWLWVHYLMRGGQAEIVRNYLTARREKQAAEPIPLVIRGRIDGAEQRLAGHLSSL